MAERTWWCPSCEVVGRSGRCWNCGRTLEPQGPEPVRRLADLLADGDTGRPMRLRDARPEERGAVATLVMEAYDEFRPYVDPAFVEGFMADLRDFESRSAHTQLIVAEGDGGISGAVTFFPDASRYGPGLPADWGAIRLLAVAPAARGSGLGRSLVAACIERAGARGSRAIVLHTTPFMQAARRLYEGMGFQRVPELDVELGAGVRVLGYRLPLAP